MNIETWHLQSKNDITDAQIDWTTTYYVCLMKDGTVRKFAQFYDECADGSVSQHLVCFEKDNYFCDDILYWIEIPEDFITENTRDYKKQNQKKRLIMNEQCGDNRFEIIEKAKKDLLESTNINTSPDEMKVLDNFLFRCWQMGWLRGYENKTKNDIL